MRMLILLLQFFILFPYCINASAEVPTHKTAIFAGGCFWCMQPPYDALKGKGVVSTRVGYTGGHKANPTYEETSVGNTGHLEAIEVIFDPKRVSYQKLLEIFWANVDPLDAEGQFCDKGEHYTSAVFYLDDEQKKAFDVSREKVIKTLKVKGSIVTPALPAKKFYPAEEYHQFYYTKNPVRYKLYRYNCGRDARLKKLWGANPKHD